MMRKTLIVLTTAAALALPSMAAASHNKAQFRYAKVVDVRTLYRTETVQIPHRECYTRTEYERVPQRRVSRRYGSAFPTVAGGVIGGVIGRQFGSGNGRDAMTVIGSLVGAAVGHNASQRRHEEEVRYTTVRSRPVEHCEVWYETEEHRAVDGYLVTYRFAGRTYTTRTDDHPGKRIRIRVNVTPVAA